MVLDLAITAFRLGRWSEVVSFTERVLTMAPDCETAMRLLVGGLAWQGRWDEALQARDQLPRPLPPFQMTDTALKLLKSLRSGREWSRDVVALVSPKGGKPDKLTIQRLDLGHAEEDAATACPPSDLRFTASIVKGGICSPDFWDKLIDLDLSCPHILVHDLRPQPVLHIIRPIEGCDDWPWEEVPVSVASLGNPRAAVPFGFMKVIGDAFAESSSHSSELWKAALAELHQMPVQWESDNEA
jgi:hypothetical protein